MSFRKVKGTCLHGVAEGDWKQSYYDHTISFRNLKHKNETALSTYLWKKLAKETPKLKWSVLKVVPGFSNISKQYLLCWNEKLLIATDNDFHNILRYFDVLPNFSFTASETMHDYYL